MAGMARHSSSAPSPNSSEEIESQHATPATKVSTFSPEETHELSSAGSRGIVRAKIPRPSTSPSPLPAVVMVLRRRMHHVSKLSPAATSFTPASSHHSPSGLEHYNSTGSSSSLKENGQATVELRADVGSPVFKTSQSGPQDELLGSTARSTLKTSPHKSFSVTLGLEHASKTFGPFSSDDGTSRALMMQLGPESGSDQLNKHLNTTMYPSLLAIVTSDVTVRGIIYVKFCDIRDADKAFSFVQSHLLGWKVQHISPATFSWKYRAESVGKAQTSNHEGQISVTARYIGTSQQPDKDQIAYDLKEALEDFGQIMAFSVTLPETRKLVFRVEYYNINSANDVMLHSDGIKLKTCSVSIGRYEPEVGPKLQTPAKTPGPIIIGQDDSRLDQALSKMTLDSYRESTLLHTPRQSLYQSNSTEDSFTGRKVAGGQHIPSPLNSLAPSYGGPGPMYSPTWTTSCNTYAGYGMTSPLWSQYSPGAIGQERGSPSLPGDYRNAHPSQPKALTRSSGRQQPDYAPGHHNVVDMDRIRAGLDVRTTIMLRNIPNKIDQAMLKDIVDETSLGKYDFMYLRIDFANNCNVGYAFINFEDPIWIVDFVNARAGHRWNRFNSDKVAEVSYATIQGRDCLIQKFRNSSVMLEHPSFRPKLYRTGTGPLVGSEETFPGPDNPSKMRRSVENAEHIGLFAPRAGQNFRDEQRRRRSQYDRGTRLAELEDSNYELDGLKMPAIAQRSRSPRPFGMFSDQFPPSYQAASYVEGLRRECSFVDVTWGIDKVIKIPGCREYTGNGVDGEWAHSLTDKMRVSDIFTTANKNEILLGAQDSVGKNDRKLGLRRNDRKPRNAIDELFTRID
ncbi:uncharacterized protein KY384_003664 [Bacidia gigantensis]|uniref:uncharacterized protein n=1 Tax=Bacidia gigantensis TaxID=2732470 RepID=UPI001D04DCBC|nr:uncharacterized protein KY384_003664 [Bacidia gigantensis]KAG8532028.1 hypothetical protein KY384_003664 [Bacidia gigantensis]